MGEVASAYVSLIPSAKGFGRELDQQIGPDVQKSGKKHGKIFGSVLKAGALGALGGAAVLTKFLGDSVAEAREAQKVGAVTAQVIKTTGGAAKISAKQVGDLATAISNKTGIDDEAIQSGANMLLTFKNIRNEAGDGNKIFDQTTQIMTDMSAAMGTDAKGSAIQLGKALNDPIKGISALSRVGVTFDAQQKKQIEGFVKAGDVMSAQKIILKELKSEFGGAAEAGATAGEKASVAFGNLKEQIGTALLPVIDKVAKKFTNDIVPAVSNFITEFQKGKGMGGDVRDAIGDIKDKLVEAYGVGKKLFDMFNSLPSGLKKAVGVAAVGGFVASKIPGGKGAIGAVTKGVVGGGVQKVFVVNPGFGAGGAPGGKVKGGKLPGLAGASPLLLPLLTSGDQGPKKLSSAQKSISAAMSQLNKDLGAKKGSGVFADVFNTDQALSRLVKSDPGKAFRILSKAADTAGTSVKELTSRDGFPKTSEAVKHAEREFGGLNRAAAGMAAGARRLTGEVFDTGTQMNRAGLSAKQYGQKLHSLPKAVQTKVTTPGAVTSRADVQTLKRQFDLTPKQVHTLIQLTGAGAAIASASHLKSVYDSLPKTVTTQAITRHVDKFERVGHNAGGTDFWKGGPTWVGERGPEILNLPRGSQIVPNHRLGEVIRPGSASGGGRGNTYNIRTFDVSKALREAQRIEAFAGGA